MILLNGSYKFTLNKDFFLEMKIVWARTEKERKRYVNCRSIAVYTTRNCDKLANKINYKKLLSKTLPGKEIFSERFLFVDG